MHYHSDAEALVLVVGSNGSPIHTDEHANAPAPDCRYCRLRQCVDDARASVKPRVAQTELRVAIGLACPAIEAWYLCGTAADITEAAWGRELAAGASAPSRIRELKRVAYGTDRPGLAMETEHAVGHMQLVVEDLESSRQSFPGGVGSMARQIQSWRSPESGA